MHIKINNMPNTWPLQRKGSKRTYIAKPNHAKTKGISLLFVIRDILQIAKTRKEVKYILTNGDVKVNNKVRKDENFPVQVFDVIGFEKTKKNYRLEIENKKFKLAEINAKESETKIVKISGKKILGKGKVQINLEDGTNFITKTKFSVGDSIILNTKTNKIEKVLSLKEGAKVEIIIGKHAGEKGVVKGIEKLSRGNNYLIKLDKKEVIIPPRTLLVIE